MNYYTVLGVEPTATPDEIKSAYRKQAIKHHPDSGGDSEQFQKLSEAYDVLKDPHKRAAFDHRNARGAYTVFDDLGATFEFTVNGQRRRAAPQRRNRNLTINLEIELHEALTDASKTVSIKHTNGQRKYVNVTVPKGTITGNLKYKGLGDHSFEDLPPGDLLVKVTTKSHKDYILEGVDLRRRITISVWEAILGTSVTLQTLNGKTVQIQIPAGTQHGTVLNIPGHGLPRFKHKINSMGRMLVEVLIKIPQNLTEKQLNKIKDLME